MSSEEKEFLHTKVSDVEADLLTFEPSQNGEKDQYTVEVKKVLSETQDELKQANLVDPSKMKGWNKAGDVVENFQPVPWFIWRLSNFVFGRNGRPNKVSEGLVLGLRRLLFAAASDKVLGSGQKVNNMREALKFVRSDVVAAVSVIHGISRKLHAGKFEKVWRPILDDAIIRAHIGFFVGQMNLDFGPGRGMLAGFAGRCGLAVLICTGDAVQADAAVKALALGEGAKQVGLQVYGVDPLQVSAMILSASGCGKDASFGVVGYSVREEGDQDFKVTGEQEKWLAALGIIEGVRIGAALMVQPEYWEILGFHEEDDRQDLLELVKVLVRKGHGWNWLF